MTSFFHAQHRGLRHVEYGPMAAHENRPTMSHSRGWDSPRSPARARQGRVGQLLWQWLRPKPQGLLLNVLVIHGQCIFTSVICMELLPLSNLKVSTFYFKMTLQVLLCDTHFNSPLILHNSHMIQCVCFMRQTWHMKIKNRFLVWNTETNCRGKKKKQWAHAQRSGWREKGRKKQDETSESLHPAQSENSFHQYERQSICTNLLHNTIELCCCISGLALEIRPVYGPVVYQ